MQIAGDRMSPCPQLFSRLQFIF